MSASASVLEPPPPRQAWEEPPVEGWGSHLGGVGREILALLAGLLAAVGAWRCFGLAQRLDASGGERGTFTDLLVVSLWGASFTLAAVLAVVLWRVGGGLAIVTAMLTDQGRVARFGGRPPIWLDEPPPGGLRIAHLTDLHITEAENVRCAERNVPGGNRAFAALLERPELREADVIIVTGDVTDRGTDLSWQRVREAIMGAGLSDRIVLVPGNHDLALIDPWGGWRDPARHWRRSDRFGIVQLANLLKFCETFAVTLGGKTGWVLKGGAPVKFQEAFAACEKEVRALVHTLPEQPIPRQGLGSGFFARKRAFRAYHLRIARARNRLLALFPVAVLLPGNRGVLFVVNSCTPVARHPATNALGHVGRAQHRRLDKLAALFAEPLKLVALHHHVVRRSEELSHGLRKRIVAKLTVLDDALPLVRFCRKYNVRAVLHGHRHLSYQLRLPNGTVLLAAPSSTMGDQLAHDPRPQFERYDVAAESVEPSVGVFRRVVHLAPMTAAATPPSLPSQG
ncbi:MAG TPA: metallophosphoesterase [Polyangia bacterium]